MNILKAVNLRKIYGQGETEVRALDGMPRPITLKLSPSPVTKGRQPIMSAAEPIMEGGVPATLATMVLPLRSTIGRDAFTSTP